MIETSIDLLRKSSAIIGIFRKKFADVSVAIGHVLKNLRKVVVFFNMRRDVLFAILGLHYKQRDSPLSSLLDLYCTLIDHECNAIRKERQISFPKQRAI